MLFCRMVDLSIFRVLPGNIVPSSLMSTLNWSRRFFSDLFLDTLQSKPQLQIKTQNVCGLHFLFHFHKITDVIFTKQSYRFALSFSSSSINPSKMLQSSLRGKRKKNIYRRSEFSHFGFLSIYVCLQLDSMYVLLIIANDGC